MRAGDFHHIDKRKAVLDSAAVLDEAYWNASEEENSESASKESSDAQSLKYFSRAKALSAVAFCAEEDPIEAAVEAIYEAISAVNDPTDIVEKVKDRIEH